MLHTMVYIIKFVRGIRKKCNNRQILFFELQKHSCTQTVNPSGKAGAQIPQLPLGDNSPPWGDNALCT
jgi:hypothetical protein